MAKVNDDHHGHDYDYDYDYENYLCLFLYP
jgi:hypothetical protein